jgi:hypothetical protein
MVKPFGAEASFGFLATRCNKIRVETTMTNLQRSRLSILDEGANGLLWFPCRGQTYSGGFFWRGAGTAGEEKII